MLNYKKLIAIFLECGPNIRKLYQEKRTKVSLGVLLASIFMFFLLKILYVVLILFVRNEYSCEIKTEYKTSWRNNLHVNVEFKNAKSPMSIKYENIKVSFVNRNKQELISVETGSGKFEKGENVVLDGVFNVCVNDNNAFFDLISSRQDMYIKIVGGIKPRFSGVRLPFFVKFSKIIYLKSTNENSEEKSFCKIGNLDVKKIDQKIKTIMDINFAKNHFPKMVNFIHKSFNFKMFDGGIVFKCGEFEIVDGNFLQPFHVEFEILRADVFDKLGLLMHDNYSKKNFSIKIEELCCNSETISMNNDKTCILHQLLNDLVYTFYNSKPNCSTTKMKFNFNSFIGNILSFNLKMVNKTIMRYFDTNTKFVFDILNLDVVSDNQIVGEICCYKAEVEENYLKMSYKLKMISDKFFNLGTENIHSRIYNIYAQNFYGKYLENWHASFSLINGLISIFGVQIKKNDNCEFLRNIVKSNNALLPIKNGLSVVSSFDFGNLNNDEDICFEFKKGFSFFIESEMYKIESKFSENCSVYISKENNRCFEKLRGALKVVFNFTFYKKYFKNLDLFIKRDERYKGMSPFDVIYNSKMKLNGNVCINNPVRIKHEKCTSEKTRVKIFVDQVYDKYIHFGVNLNSFIGLCESASFEGIFTVTAPILFVGEVDSITINPGEFKILYDIRNGIAAKTDPFLISYIYDNNSEHGFELKALKRHISNLFYMNVPKITSEFGFSEVVKQFLKCFRNKEHVNLQNNTNLKPYSPDNNFKAKSLNMNFTYKKQTHMHLQFDFNIDLLLVNDSDIVLEVFIPSFNLCFNNVITLHVPKIVLNFHSDGSISFSNIEMILYSLKNFDNYGWSDIVVDLFQIHENEDHKMKLNIDEKLRTLRSIFVVINSCQYRDDNGRSTFFIDKIISPDNNKKRGHDQDLKSINLKVDASLEPYDPIDFMNSMRRFLYNMFKGRINVFNMLIDIKSFDYDIVLFNSSSRERTVLLIESVYSSFTLNLHNPLEEVKRIFLNIIFSLIVRENKVPIIDKKSLIVKAIDFYMLNSRSQRTFHKFKNVDNLIFLNFEFPINFKYTCESDLFAAVKIDNSGFILSLFPECNLFNDDPRIHSVILYPFESKSHIQTEWQKVLFSSYYYLPSLSSVGQFMLCHNNEIVGFWFEVDSYMASSFAKSYVFYSKGGSSYWIPRRIFLAFAHSMGVPLLVQHKFSKDDAKLKVYELLKKLERFKRVFLARTGRIEI